MHCLRYRKNFHGRILVVRFMRRGHYRGDDRFVKLLHMPWRDHISGFCRDLHIVLGGHLLRSNFNTGYLHFMRSRIFFYWERWVMHVLFRWIIRCLNWFVFLYFVFNR